MFFQETMLTFRRIEASRKRACLVPTGSGESKLPDPEFYFARNLLSSCRLIVHFDRPAKGRRPAYLHRSSSLRARLFMRRAASELAGRVFEPITSTGRLERFLKFGIGGKARGGLVCEAISATVGSRPGKTHHRKSRFGRSLISP